MNKTQTELDATTWIYDQYAAWIRYRLEFFQRNYLSFKNWK